VATEYFHRKTRENNNSFIGKPWKQHQFEWETMEKHQFSTGSMRKPQNFAKEYLGKKHQIAMGFVPFLH